MWNLSISYSISSQLRIMPCNSFLVGRKYAIAAVRLETWVGPAFCLVCFSEYDILVLLKLLSYRFSHQKFTPPKSQFLKINLR